MAGILDPTPIKGCSDHNLNGCVALAVYRYTEVNKKIDYRQLMNVFILTKSCDIVLKQQLALDKIFDLFYKALILSLFILSVMSITETKKTGTYVAFGTGKTK